MDIYRKSNMIIQMNKPWQIPRASLSSTSSQSGDSQKSNSNPSSINRSTKMVRGGHNNNGFDGKLDETQYVTVHQSNKKRKDNQNDQLKIPSRSVTPDGIKRGSHSSQGSTDSNHSTRSASSGSLLLTTANLELFTQNQKNNPTHRPTYSTNITIQQSLESGKKRSGGSDLNGIVIPIDANLMLVKTKEIDTISIASSTHFTMVNGVGGPQRPIKNGLCSRGHQITILIVTMSLLFLIGIIAAVFLLEVRAKKMPH